MKRSHSYCHMMHCIKSLEVWQKTWSAMFEISQFMYHTTQYHTLPYNLHMCRYRAKHRFGGMQDILQWHPNKNIWAEAGFAHFDMRDVGQLILVARCGMKNGTGTSDNQLTFIHLLQPPFPVKVCIILFQSGQF